jgi:enoyl-[acyl-carrier protein] reductase/trans-2-enoyl-CoA reductase (NAD+)
MIKPIIKNNICLNLDPAGCALDVQRQIDYALRQRKIKAPKTALIIGGSMGYGLAARITAAFSAGMNTHCVAYERPATATRPGSSGWYNTVYFEKQAEHAGLKARHVFGDAFSDEIKAETFKLLKEEFGPVDLVIYSVASGVRRDPHTGITHRSFIKPIGLPLSAQTINLQTRELVAANLEPASDLEIAETVKVMGGEDWRWWMEDLLKADLLAPDVLTSAFSYIGPEQTFPIYRDGTLGRAKQDVETAAAAINKLLKGLKGRAFVSVNKALVTRSSSVIPLVPLYISILYKVMKAKGIHEGCIEQMYRLLGDRLYADKIEVDGQGRIRLDDYELRADVQVEVRRIWKKLTNDNLAELTDIEGYEADFLALHGFAGPLASGLGLAV